ncbi:MAG: alpha-1,2-fucosyltransferase, partial [Bacteroidaceae bacterium]|nr:alpha-1,2-fucosyltransferase [Bacteroidaceae bacterium]
MRLIKMTGGLGNQMFIYALYLRMKSRYPKTWIDLSDMVHYKVHHGYEMNRVFRLPHTEICLPQWLKKALEFLFFRTILERHEHGSLRHYDGKILWPLVYYKGFYQNLAYLEGHEEEIRRAFTFDMELASQQNKALASQIDAEPNSVSLHIRRGDYLKPEHYKAVGCVC